MYFLISEDVAIEDGLKQVVEKKATLEKSLEKVLSFLKSKEMVEMLKEEKLFNMSYIKANFQFEEKDLELLFSYAKLLYEQGLYLGKIVFISF